MPVKPRKGESQNDFMGRCVPLEVDAGHPQNQAVAICMSKWRDKKSADEMYPEDNKKPKGKKPGYKKPKKK